MDALTSLAPILKSGADQLLDDQSARQLAIVRNLLQLKQQAVAAEVGISQSYLHDLETCHRHLRLRMFTRIKEAMERLSR